MKIIITAGGTSEYIDKVRKITNSSSGKLGSIIANNILISNLFTDIYYIHTPNSFLPNTTISSTTQIHNIEIINTNDLKIAVETLLKTEKIDWFIHSMAVSDYYVDFVTTASLLEEDLKDNNITNIIKDPINKLDNSDKLSSNEDNLVLVLKQTPKIISLIKKLSPNTHLVGFKLLENITEDYLISIATKLMEKNNCDYVVANDLKNIKQGQHKAILIDNYQNKTYLNTKEEIAQELIKVIQRTSN